MNREDAITLACKAIDLYKANERYRITIRYVSSRSIDISNTNALHKYLLQHSKDFVNLTVSIDYNFAIYYRSSYGRLHLICIPPVEEDHENNPNI